MNDLKVLEHPSFIAFFLGTAVALGSISSGSWRNPVFNDLFALAFFCVIGVCASIQERRRPRKVEFPPWPVMLVWVSSFIGFSELVYALVYLVKLIWERIS